MLGDELPETRRQRKAMPTTVFELLVGRPCCTIHDVLSEMEEL